MSGQLPARVQGGAAQKKVADQRQLPLAVVFAWQWLLLVVNIPPFLGHTRQPNAELCSPDHPCSTHAKNEGRNTTDMR